MRTGFFKFRDSVCSHGFACKSADKLSGMANCLSQNRIFPVRQLVSHLLKSFEYICLQNCKAHARTQGGGGVHWVHVQPPTWEKSFPQKCPKEERKFRPDMSAKKNVHVPLRYDKTKTKKLGKKEENSKRNGLKLRNKERG